MPTHRILRLINLSIAVFLVIFVIAAFWYAWRPLPKISGTVSLPVEKAATIARDKLGVPHIIASSWQDAVFLQGYVTAQDRMWQMDALRRVAAGELSEVVGEAAIETDREARRLRMRRVAEAHFKALAPGDRAVMAAYARGVNHYLEANKGKYSLEFAVLRYDPKPWSVVDTLLVGMQMYRILTASWKTDIQKQALIESGGNPEKVNELFPVRTGREESPGSNAWAISGKHTGSGKPILASDPHLEFSNPSTWYQVHLSAPGFNVTGVSLPGVPCVLIGHNDRIAWGITNLHYDVQDLYLERFNPANGQYLFRGQLEQARAERDIISVKGKAPITFTTWVTRHGPIFINENNRYVSLRWTGSEPGLFSFPFFDLNRARNWDEFNSALKRMPGPGSNVVYADVDGNIGYHAAGMLPIRKNFSGDQVLEGSSGEFEWDGYIPYEELPSSYNPASGVIVTANQNPFPAGYAYRIGGDFAAPYRAHQIRELLKKKEGWTAEEMLAVQKDVYSAFSHFLAKELVKVYDRRKPEGEALQAAVGELRNWDGQMDQNSSAAMIASVVFVELRKQIAGKASPGNGLLYTSQIAPAVVERLLRERPAAWKINWDDLLVKAFADGVEEGAKREGGNPREWKYGRYNALTLKQLVTGQLPLVGSYFNIGPAFMSGSSTTVKQTTPRLGPSMRFVADLANWDKSLNNITIGQSGHYFSPHYKDQWKSYWVGRSFPMQFQKVEAEDTLEVRPE